MPNRRITYSLTLAIAFVFLAGCTQPDADYFMEADDSKNSSTESVADSDSKIEIPNEDFSPSTSLFADDTSIHEEIKSRSGYPPYEGGKSEDRLQKLFDEIGVGPRGNATITDVEVFQVMGEPTTRTEPMTLRKDGKIITIYQAEWLDRKAGIQSSIGFINGRVSSLLLGLKINN